MNSNRLPRLIGLLAGQVLSAEMAAFQITPACSSDTSWAVVNDSTTLEKNVTSVVTATFSLK